MTVVVRHRGADAESSEALRRAVAADNPAYVEVRTEGAELVVRTSANSARTVRSTIDDLMACLTAAERARAMTPKR